MRTYDRATDSSSQSDVLCWMEKYPDTWFTTKQIQEAVGSKSREKIGKFLRKLHKFKFVEKQRTVGTNELLYKINELEPPRDGTRKKEK